MTNRTAISIQYIIKIKEKTLEIFFLKSVSYHYDRKIEPSVFLIKALVLKKEEKQQEN